MSSPAFGCIRKIAIIDTGNPRTRQSKGNLLCIHPFPITLESSQEANFADSTLVELEIPARAGLEVCMPNRTSCHSQQSLLAA